MAKPLFLDVHGSAERTNAAIAFIMADGAIQAGHAAQIALPTGQPTADRERPAAPARIPGVTR
jgi:hypothetical protein